MPARAAFPQNPDPLTSPYLSLGRQIRVQLTNWAREVYREHFEDRLIQLPGGRGPARLGKIDLELVLRWPLLFEVEVRLDVRLKNVT